MEEIKYGQLWARHSELVEADQVGKYYIPFHKFKKAIEEAVSILHPTAGAVWVKASERLPGIRAEVKWRIDGEEWEAKETVLGMWYNRPDTFNKHEWLDEVVPLTQSRADLIREVNNRALGGVSIGEDIKEVLAGFIKVARHIRNYPNPQLTIELLRSEAVLAETKGVTVLGADVYDQISELGFKGE